MNGAFMKISVYKCFPLSCTQVMVLSIHSLPDFDFFAFIATYAISISVFLDY